MLFCIFQTATLSIDHCDVGVAVKYGRDLDYNCASSVTHELEPRYYFSFSPLHSHLSIYEAFSHNLDF